MTTDNTLFLCNNVHDEKGTEWANSFINTFRDAASTFFKTMPEILSSADNIGDRIKISKAALIVASSTESEQYTNELNQIKSLRAKDANFPVLIIYPSRPTVDSFKFNINDSLSYRFFDTDPDTRQARTYRLNGSSAEYTLFWSLLLDVFYDLSEVLMLRDRTSDLESQSVVYISPVTSELAGMRNRIVRELRQRQVIVYPDFYKSKSNSFDEMLAECDLAVHLIGYQYKDLVAGNETTNAEWQCKQTSAFCIQNSAKLKSKGLSVYRLVCLPMQPEKADEQQQQFIQSLRYDEASELTEIVQLPVEEIKILIIERLNQKRKSRLEHETDSVYLIYDPQSDVNIPRISGAIVNSGFSIKSIQYNSGISLTNQHKLNLSISDTIVIVDENAPAQWILSKIKDVVKAPGNGRNIPFKDKIVITSQQQRLLEIANHNGFELLSLDENIESSLAKSLSK